MVSDMLWMNLCMWSSGAVAGTMTAQHYCCVTVDPVSHEVNVHAGTDVCIHVRGGVGIHVWGHVNICVRYDVGVHVSMKWASVRRGTGNEGSTGVMTVLMGGNGHVRELISFGSSVQMGKYVP
jgi:hypothetical protein